MQCMVNLCPTFHYTGWQLLQEQTEKAPSTCTEMLDTVSDSMQHDPKTLRRAPVILCSSLLTIATAWVQLPDAN